ncbi:MAG: hypothetical protein HUJ29_01055 [Gammaproteobacteria bacterium]|nr:hypothetical protein [Gammaproteobacteria bacterium]
MQEANNIYIRLINLQEPCSEETSQTIHYRSMSDAVSGFEKIRSHSTDQDNAEYAAQFCVNQKIVSEYFLDKPGYSVSLGTLGFSTSHAA